MSRLLNIILILSVLVTQSAWAIHGVDIDNGSPEQVYTQAAEQHDVTAEACNHFCHASAHLVGLFSDSSLDIQAACDSHEPTSKSLVSSLSYQPPVPPPIS